MNAATNATEPTTLIDAALKAQAARKAAEADLARIEASCDQHEAQAIDWRQRASVEIGDLQQKRDAAAAAVALGEIEPAAFEKAEAELESAARHRQHAQYQAGKAEATAAGLRVRAEAARAALAGAREIDNAARLAVWNEQRASLVLAYRRACEQVRLAALDLEALYLSMRDDDSLAGRRWMEGASRALDVDKVKLPFTALCQDDPGWPDTIWWYGNDFQRDAAQVSVRFNSEMKAKGIDVYDRPPLELEPALPSPANPHRGMSLSGGSL